MISFLKDTCIAIVKTMFLRKNVIENKLPFQNCLQFKNNHLKVPYKAFLELKMT